jgi:hypothetical protein
MPSTFADRFPGLRRAARRTLCAGLVAAAISLPPAAVTRAADATPPAVQKFPEPSIFPVSWELRFRHAAPKRIVVQLPQQKYAAAYWYMTYTVTNVPSKDLGNEARPDPTFEPEADLIDNETKSHRANSAIPEGVFDAIKAREQNKLLTSPRKIGGPIAPGDEQARDGVLIWPEPLRKMGTFSIFIAGLSGETVTMKKVGEQYVAVPADKEFEELKDVKPEDRRMLRKQLQLTYQVVGDEHAPADAPVVKKAETWVMR